VVARTPEHVLTITGRLIRAKFPHPLVLLMSGVIIAALLTWILPAGEYLRQHDALTNRDVVVPGTYHAVASHPVGIFGVFVGVPQGMIAAADVIFLVFLVGGAFAVVERTGALARGMNGLVRVLDGHESLVIPVVSIAFATAGVLEHMQEEIIALIPVLLILTRRLRYDPLVAVAISIGAAAVGAAFSPIDPFQVGIAQKLAHLPLLSGAMFRIAFLVPALAIWIWATMRYAARTRIPASETPLETPGAAGARSTIVLLTVLATFAVFVYGVFALGWDFPQMSALFFVMGIVAGLVGGLGITGTTEAFVDGFRGMAYAALLIGFARAISVVLEQGSVVDTIVYGLFTPLAHLPLLASAFGMVALQALLHFPVPSVSGQAVLTIPVLSPLADLLGMSRQVMVLTYQYGAGICELITPTNGALVAILAAAEVPFEKWLRVVMPALGLLYVLALVAVAVGIATGLR
jgi:uncharacterized ion transporter superfamily protein YfcC